MVAVLYRIPRHPEAVFTGSWKGLKTFIAADFLACQEGSATSDLLGL